MQDYAAAPPRPSSLTLVAVLAIVLGALSMCCGLYAGAGLVMTDRLQAMSQQLAGAGRAADDPLVREQRALQAELVSFQAGWAPYTGAFVVLQLAVGLACLLGGGLALAGKGLGRAVLLSAFGAGALVELVRGVAETVMQFEQAELTKRYLARVMVSAQQGRHGAPGMEQTMGAVMGGATAAAVVLLLLWALLKLAYYVAGALVLRREDVRRYLD